MTTIAFIIGTTLSLLAAFTGLGPEYDALSVRTKLLCTFSLAANGFLFLVLGMSLA